LYIVVFFLKIKLLHFIYSKHYILFTANKYSCISFCEYTEKEKLVY